MLLLRMLHAVFFLLLLNVSFAQKGMNQEVKLRPDQSVKVETSPLDITPEQMHAIRQIELEFAAREERKKLTDENYEVDLPKRAAEREDKIKNILSPEQWKKYQEFHSVMLEQEKKMAAERKTKSFSGNKATVID